MTGELGEQRRRDSFARDALNVHQSEGTRQSFVVTGSVEFLVGGDGIRHQKSRWRKLAMRQEGGRSFVGARERPVKFEAAVTQIKAGKLTGLEARDSDAQGVETLERGAHVEDRFHA